MRLSTLVPHITAFAVVLVAPAFAHAQNAPIRFAEPAEIAGMLDECVTLDTRPIGSYLSGHVPGAVHIDDECLRGTRDGLPVQYCAPDVLAGMLGQAGVTFDTTVVVYADDSDPLAATMTSYALARIGHDNVVIMSGGFSAWAANHDLSQSFPVYETVDLTPREPTMDAIAFEQFADDIGYGDRVFIDARPNNLYRGDAGVWPRNGHIPSAHSLDWKQLTESDNNHRLLPRDQIEAKLSDLGASAWDDIVVYCGTGREATLLAIVLSCELGWHNVKLYEGSWTEYSALPASRVEVGQRHDPQTRVHTDGRVHFSGQPAKDELRELVESGVTTIVSCRTTREMDALSFDEASFLETLGVRYVHIPMGGDDGYTPGQTHALAQVLDDTDDNVLVHCASGGRARLLWTGYLIEHEGININDALQRNRDIGGRQSSLERLLGRDVQYELQDQEK